MVHVEPRRRKAVSLSYLNSMRNLGVYEFWRELLQGEVESPTIRFAGTTERYTWRQNAETVEVS